MGLLKQLKHRANSLTRTSSKQTSKTLKASISHTYLNTGTNTGPWGDQMPPRQRSETKVIFSDSEFPGTPFREPARLPPSPQPRSSVTASTFSTYRTHSGLTNARDVGEGKLEMLIGNVSMTSPDSQRSGKQHVSDAEDIMSRMSSKALATSSKLTLQTGTLTHWLRLLTKEEDRGYFLWPIHPYSKIRREHRSTTTTMLVSPDFRTSWPVGGYKLRALINVAGTGEFRGKFMCVYWQLQQSAEDDQLTWPFEQRVSIQLMPAPGFAGEAVRAVSSSYSDLPSFQRPKHQKPNKAWGFKKFCPITIAESPEYLQEDTLWLLIRVFGN